MLLDSALAQQDFSSVEIQTTPINGGYSVLYGAGGNIGVFVGSEGIILIDDQFAPLSGRINEAIDRISNLDIKFLINTHWHGDHTGGNENFAADGAVIVAHEYVRRRMSMEVFLPLYNSRTQPSPISALPSVTFLEDISFHWDGETITAIHVPNAHTDTDAFVHFANANIIHMGDLLWTNSYPRIDVQYGGGSVNGYIAAIGKSLELADENTQFISGHGPIPEQGRRYVENYLLMLRTVRDRVNGMIADGMSEMEIIRARPTSEFDSEWVDEFSYIDADMFTRIMYISLSQ
tara:strand:+ start:10283 stop:11155 length:873 start_codon:yes stop_codon:yes gene_type:complete